MEINEAKDRQYAAAFTAVNAPNVFNKIQTRLTEPFPQQPELPLGQPPVRYPDVTTMGGFLEDPREDEQDRRNVAVRLAADENADGAMPMDIDDVVTMGDRPQPVFKIGEENVSKDELFRRAFMPRPDRHPQLLW